MKKRTRHTIGRKLKIAGLAACIFSVAVISFLETPIKKISGAKADLLAVQMVCFGIGCLLWGLGALTDPETRLGRGRINEEAARGFAVLLGLCLMLFGVFVSVLFGSFLV
ncbi:MAG: hypothetical protein ACTTKL_00225 [Treponema sp.]